MKILLDTSFLLTAIKYKVDIFDELKSNELIILDGVKKELETLIKTKKKGKLEAKIALELIKKNRVKIKKSKIKSVDDSLVAEKYAVATQDRELKKRLKNRKVITIRQKRLVKNVLWNKSKGSY